MLDATRSEATTPHFGVASGAVHPTVHCVTFDVEDGSPGTPRWRSVLVDDPWHGEVSIAAGDLRPARRQLHFDLASPYLKPWKIHGGRPYKGDSYPAALLGGDKNRLIDRYDTIPEEF